MSEQKIIQGDCVAEMRKFPEETFDLVLTSPPYDNLRDYNGYSFDFEGTAREIYRVLKDGGVCVWVVGDQTVNGSETGTSFRQALFFQSLGLNIHDTMIYQKKSCYTYDPRNRRYKHMFEFMFVFSKDSPKTYNPIVDVPNIHAGTKIHGTAGRSKSGEKRRVIPKVIGPLQARSNIWEVPSSERVDHPAPFPLQLARDHILSWSNEGDTVLDPFLGSGTTLLAAKELNRNGVGVEISPEYCEIARQRLLPDLALHNK